MLYTWEEWPSTRSKWGRGSSLGRLWRKNLPHSVNSSVFIHPLSDILRKAFSGAPKSQSAFILLPLKMIRFGPYPPPALMQERQVEVSPFSPAVISKQGDPASATTLVERKWSWSTVSSQFQIWSGTFSNPSLSIVSWYFWNHVFTTVRLNPAALLAERASGFLILIFWLRLKKPLNHL